MIANFGFPTRLGALVGAIAAVSTAGANVLLPAVLSDQEVGNSTAKSTGASSRNSALSERLRQSSAAFMENRGQWNDDARYLARTPNMNLWVTDNGLRTEYYATYQVKGQTIKRGQVVDMSFVGGEALSDRGFNRTPTITQFIRPDGTTTVRSYASVELKSLYRGIDLRVYNQDGRPRYDIVALPGSKPEDIKLRFRGADKVAVDGSGKLVLGTKEGSLEHRNLFAYQVRDGRTVQVPAKFKMVGGSDVKLDLGAFDRDLPLVIDPIVYGTYYGGDGGIDEVRAVTADADAGIYFTGATQAPDFPILFGPFSVNITGASDTYLAKLRGDAYVHEYSAYIGGSGRETGKFIALSPNGTTVWIAGMTTSANFPGVTGGSFQAALAGTNDAFLIAFNKDAQTVLAHGYSTYYGGTGTAEQLTGFAVAPVTGDLVLSGHSNAAVPGSAAPPAAQSAWVARLNPAGTAGIWAKFHGGTAQQISGAPGGTVPSLNSGLTGLNTDTTSAVTGNSVAVDATDNVLIVGTVVFTGNQDTAIAPTPAYPTTAVIFPSGRLLRNADVYIAKFASNGAVVYSGLLGGANTDIGSAITVDESGNAYLTGIAGSADFPRTNGTFGQTFTVQPNVFVTKISTDGAQLVYSTNLRTTGPVAPMGIGVNQRGFAFITGIVDASITFPQPPGDPNTPNSSTSGTIFTRDAIRATNTFPTPQDLPATDGFLTILNSTAEDVLFSTYIGGQLDDVAFAPYVDRIGDVWVSGYADSSRRYIRTSSGGTQTLFQVISNGMDAGFITALAFKSVIEPGLGAGTTTFNSVPYGIRESPFTAPAFINGVMRTRDGYLFRFRLDIPLVTDLALNPTSIAGGLGQQSTGTVTISGPAPAEGVDVVVTLDSTNAASLDPNSPVGQRTVSIAPGATTATFTIYSSPVIDPTQVQVKAEYLGSFKIKQLTVNPWLNQLTLNPTTVPSGTQSVGRVTLFTTANQDVTVTVTTDNPGLISFPNGNTVTVPAGQQSVNFPVQTSTVDVQLQGNVSASLLGKTRTQVLVVRPAILASLAFVPNRVAGGGTSTGTVTLDGNAPSTGAVVSLTTITNPGNIASMPPTVTIPANARSANFTVVTNLVPANTFSVIRSSYNGTNRDATLLIDNVSLFNFTLSPDTVNGGGSVTGTVTLNQPAPPGGAYVNLTTNSANVILPDEDPATPGFQVLVAANNTDRSFSIGTNAILAQEIAIVSASRGGVPIDRTLTINPLAFTISVNPSSILGGQPSTLTVTLTGAAPAGGVPIQFSLGSVLPNPPDNSGAVTINGGNPVVVPAGQTTQQYPITTSAVAQTDTVIITGLIVASGNTSSTNLTVRAPKVIKMSFTPSVVRGLVGTSTLTVLIDGPAPVGGATIALTELPPNEWIANVPPSITIPQGQSSGSVIVTTNKVSRTLGIQVVAGFGGGSATAILYVTR